MIIFYSAPFSGNLYFKLSTKYRGLLLVNKTRMRYWDSYNYTIKVAQQALYAHLIAAINCIRSSAENKIFAREKFRRNSYSIHYSDITPESRGSDWCVMPVSLTWILPTLRRRLSIARRRKEPRWQIIHPEENLFLLHFFSFFISFLLSIFLSHHLSVSPSPQFFLSIHFTPQHSSRARK